MAATRSEDRLAIDAYQHAQNTAVLKDEHRIVVAPVTVHRILVRGGISRLADLDPPTGEQLRAVQRYEFDAPSGLVHVDVKRSAESRLAVAGGRTDVAATSIGHPSDAGRALQLLAIPTCTAPSTTTRGWLTPSH